MPEDNERKMFKCTCDPFVTDGCSPYIVNKKYLDLFLDVKQSVNRNAHAIDKSKIDHQAEYVCLQNPMMSTDLWNLIQTRCEKCHFIFDRFGLYGGSFRCYRCQLACERES
jgi:hypothetical protein